MTDTEREIKRLISYIRSCQAVNINCTVTIDKSLTHGVLNALEEIQQYREVGTVDDFQRLDYIKSRYEDETYDYCGEYGTSECGLKDRVKKLEEYEAIGTVEECRAAVEKLKKGGPIESK